MADLEQLQILEKLLNDLEIRALNLEKAYNENDSENFTRCKQEILNIQKKISGIIRRQSNDI